MDVPKTWDCDLEHYAWRDLCDRSVVDSKKYGVFRDTFPIEKGCNPTDKTNEFLNKFWNEVKNVDLSKTQAYGKDYRHFAHMANAKNTGMACSYRACNTSLNVLCIYDKT
ncbi:hypothetical protein Aduo_000412 [Ancylostoma duodenale]